MDNKVVIYDKTLNFAKRIVKMSKQLQVEKKEFVLSKQILRSGTSIGANVSEAKYAQSTKDFLSKFLIALKEANETEYWLILLQDEYLTDKEVETLMKDLKETIKILVSTTKSLKNKLSNQNC